MIHEMFIAGDMPVFLSKDAQGIVEGHAETHGDGDRCGAEVQLGGVAHLEEVGIQRRLRTISRYPLGEEAT